VLQNLDKNESVILVGSFNKLLFSSLRIGYMVLPTRLINTVLAFRFGIDQNAVGLEQAILAEFIEEEHMGRHMRRMRELHADRLQTLRNETEKYLKGMRGRICKADRAAIERRGVIGSHPRSLRGELRRLRLAAHLVSVAGSWHSSGPAACATADASARHSRSRQPALPGHDHRRWPPSTDCAQLASSQFRRGAPNQACACDITYIATEEGWLFLAVVTIRGASIKPPEQKLSSLRWFPFQSEECCLEVATQRDADSVVHPIVPAGSLYRAVG
jgi:hypothetical protein